VALTAKKVLPYLKSNDDAWFEAIFQQHWSRVYGVLFRIVGDHNEAEDLALETFWRLHESPPVERDADWLVGWLFRVATNLGFNALRARQRRVRYEEEAGNLQLEHMQYSDPAEEVQRAQEREMVRIVLGGIKPRSAQLLILRHSGLSYVEIASALELSPSSIGTLLARAEREFAKRFEKVDLELS
jgi:RNA polymerase sigma-70 factor (ECF subfamily)